MAELEVENTGEKFELEDNMPIAECCEQAGVPFACTEGVCGTCIVEVVDGMQNLSAPSQAEIDFLGDSAVKRERMACQCQIKSGLVKIKF